MTNEVLTERRKKDGFQTWLEDPTTKISMFQIPPGEHSDTLKLLLESAFKRGFECGSASEIANMLELIDRGGG